MHHKIKWKIIQPLKGSLAKRSGKNASHLSNPNFKSMKMLQSWAGL
jgi:hypothetical protein